MTAADPPRTGDLTHIIWDWNGTLLDDAAYCLDLTDRMLKAFRLRPMETLEVYREKFGFPVRDYYASLGFDPLIFPEVAVLWMDSYMHDEASIPLHRDAVEASQWFSDKKIRQVVISASKIENLHKQLETRPYFDHFDPPCGLGDIYAGSKTDIALQWMRTRQADPRRILLIGDTTHDLEVARSLGCACVLVENGHQSRRRLRQDGAQTCPTLTDVIRLLERG